MKLICAGCERIVDVAEARLEDGRVEISCPRCGDVSTVALAAEGGGADETPAAAEVEGRAAADVEGAPLPARLACPKCAGPRGDEAACPRCGLVYARWTGPATDDGDGRLAALFQEVEAAWTDEAAHGRFLEACVTSGALGFAARCYGSREADEIGRRQLDRLTALAFQSMKGSADRRGPAPKVTRLVGWTLFVLLLAGIVTFLFVMFNTMPRP